MDAGSLLQGEELNKNQNINRAYGDLIFSSVDNLLKHSKYIQKTTKILTNSHVPKLLYICKQLPEALQISMQS